MLQVIRVVSTKGEGVALHCLSEPAASGRKGRVCMAAFVSGMGTHPRRLSTTPWAAFTPEAGQTPLRMASCGRTVLTTPSRNRSIRSASNTMPHPRLKLNAGRTNCDGIVAKIGLVFTDFGGVFGLYQLELNTLFHRLRYWKIRVL